MMRTSLAFVVPMKDPARAKRRLSPVLPDTARGRFAIGLLRRTLTTLRQGFPEAVTLVVTASQEVRDVASSLGCRVLFERTEGGLNAAAAAAAEWTCSYGFESQLLIHSDIALLEARDVERVLGTPRGNPSLVLVPSFDMGTNMLVTTPPDVIPFVFGRGSYLAFRKAADERGVRHVSVHLTRAAWDIDSPCDYVRLIALTAHRGEGSKTYGVSDDRGT